MSSPGLGTAIDEGRPPQLSAGFSVHVNEVVLAIHEAGERGTSRAIESSFEPLAPMPWAD